MKVLGHGDLGVKLSVSAHAFSKGAVEKIEAAGGSVTWLKPPHEQKERRHKKAAPGAEPAATAEPAESEEAAVEAEPARTSPPRRPKRARRCSRWIANAWRVPELRRRLLFTAFVLALYRLGSFIPAPGVDSDQIKTYFGNQGGTVLGLLNLFSGNALSRFSIFALGIMPYITASIILQLGDGGRPHTRAAPEGRRGRLRQDQPVHPVPDGRVWPPRRRSATRTSSAGSTS